MPHDTLAFPATSRWLNTSGRALTAADISGRATIFTVGSLGSALCLSLARAASAFADRAGPAVLAVMVHVPASPLERETDFARREVIRRGLTGPAVLDKEGELAAKLGATGRPLFLVFGPGGREVLRRVAVDDPYQLVAEAESLLLGILGDANPAPLPRAPEEIELPESALRFPAGLALGPDNLLVVADTGNHRLLVCRLDPERPLAQVLAVAGTGQPGAADGEFSACSFALPRGVAVSPDGRYAVVADAGNGCVRRLDLAKRTVSTILSPGSCPAVPISVCHGRRRIFVGGAGAHPLWAATPAGGGSAPLPLTGPFATAPEVWGMVRRGAPHDDLILSDATNHALWRVGPDGGHAEHFAGSAEGKPGDDAGTTEAPAPGLLQHPCGLAGLPDGRVLVADAWNSRLRVAEAGGNALRTVAGKGRGYVEGEKPRFREPEAMAAGERGIFIADTGNHQVRRIDAYGVTELIVFAG